MKELGLFYDACHTQLTCRRDENGDGLKWCDDYSLEIEEEEYELLKVKYKTFLENEFEDLKKSHPNMVYDEYFLHRDMPDLYKKIRQKMEEILLDLYPFLTQEELNEVDVSIEDLPWEIYGEAYFGDVWPWKLAKKDK